MEESRGGGHGRRRFSGTDMAVIPMMDGGDVAVFFQTLSRRIVNLYLEVPSFPEDGCPGFQMPALGLTFRGKAGEREGNLLADALLLEKSGPVFAAAMQGRAGLRLFVSAHCPHCPGALRLVLGFLENEGLDLEVVNVDHCPDMAAALRIMAVPVLMLRGDEETFRWTGSLNRRDVEKALLEKTPESLGEESLINILESGDAQRLAEMMRMRGMIFPALYTLLAHEKWTVRLGAMVAAETLISLSPDLGEVLLEGLWQRHGSMEPSVLGDMLYLMGLGNPGLWFSRLNQLSSHSHEQVQEALGEALENLKERM